MRAHMAVAGRTKRTAARLAVSAAIQDELLKPGDRLPPETVLTDILGVSLGTTQAALRQLQQIGTIVRRRGDGSRVASVEPLTENIWHFRIIDKASLLPLHLQSQEIDISSTTSDGPWRTFLDRAANLVRISRITWMDDGSRIFAEMMLDEDAAPGLLKTPPEELDMINIRPYLEEAFGLRTAYARHTVQIITPDRSEHRSFDFESGETYFEIHARAFSDDGSPVYFQRFYVLAARYVLDF